jgi:undecaprenyl-diphosphatase
MDLIHVVILALIQGLTEFLPISSSAHLILVPYLVGWPDQGLAFDVAVHVGTLSAVVLYFRQQLRKIAVDCMASLVQRRRQGDSMLGWAVLFGTVPAGIAGLLVNDVAEAYMRSTVVIALATMAFGLLLGWADITGRRTRSEHEMTWKDVLVIGCAQAIALIPGTSRSGITMTAGLMLGLTREGAARFSFLLSIPVILLAGGLKTGELMQQPNAVDWQAMGLGALVAGVSAYICIHYFLKLLDRIGMMPYVIYRMLLGTLLLYFAYN